MADITVDSAIGVQSTAHRFGPIWHDASTGYIFYKDADASWVYSKTSDNGLNWGAPVTIQASSPAYPTFSLWYDKGTPGNSGTVVHIVMARDTKMIYRSFDTSDDSIGSEITVRTAAGGGPASVSIVRVTGGNLYIVDTGSNDATWSASFMRSTDVGATWSSRSLTDSNIVIAVSNAKLVPGNASDDNDCLMIFNRDSTKKTFAVEYDDSGNSWTSVELFTSGLFRVPENAYNVSVRHSDGHAIVAVREVTASTNDGVVRTWDITDIGTITEKTKAVDPLKALILGITPAINNLNDDIYVFYQYGTPNRGVFYTKSTDNMATWGSEVAYSDSTYTDLNVVSASLSIGAEGGHISATFGLSTAVDLLYNAANAVAIAAASANSFDSLVNAGIHVQVLVDWDDDNDFTHVTEDISNDVQSVSQRHKRDLFNEYMSARVVDVIVDNNDHTYSPPNALSPIVVDNSGVVGPGFDAWIRTFYPFDAFDGATVDLDAHEPDNDAFWTWVQPIAGQTFELDGSGAAVTKEITSADHLAYLEFNDTDVTIGLNVVTPSSGGNSGVLMRFVNATNYMKVRISTGSASNIELISVIAGSETTEETGSFSVSNGDSIFVVVQMHGTRYRVLLNNQEVIDGTFTNAAIDGGTKHGILCHGASSASAEWLDFGGFKSMIFGKVENVTPNVSTEGVTSTIRIIDNFEQFKRTQLRAANTLETSGAVSSGTMMDDILDAANFFSNRRVIDTGTSIMDDVDDGLKGIGSDALQAVHQLQDEEDGFAYIDGMGYLHFEGRTHRTTAPHTTSKVTIQDLIDAVGRKMSFSKFKWSSGSKGIENAVVITAQRVEKGDAETIVWRHPDATLGRTGSTEISIPNTESRDFIVDIGEAETGRFEAANAWRPPDVREPPSSPSATIGVNATAASESGAEWTGETNVFASDDSYAVYAGTGQSELRITNLLIGDIPTTPDEQITILGFKVFVEGNGDSAVDAERDIDVFLTKDGTNTVGSAETVRLNQTTDSNNEAGGSQDLFGTTWVVSEIDSTTFGVIIKKSNANNNGINIDHVQLSVFYVDDLQANSAADGSGTEVTDLIEVSEQETSKYAGKWRKIRLTNNSGATAYITRLRVRATPFIIRKSTPVGNANSIQDNEIEVAEEDSTSITLYGERRKVITAQFISRYTAARTTALNRLARRKDPKAEIILLFRPPDQITLKHLVQRQLSDTVTLTYSDMGIDETFYIEGEEWRITDGGKKIDVLWQLREVS